MNPSCVLLKINAGASRIEYPLTRVGSEVSSDITLLDYLRKTLELRGTKYMCMDGSCGACIVTAVLKPGSIPVAVNSCLVPVTSCNDWDITTVEKVGNKLSGYHPIQKRLAEVNGTQCGYCTPGMVMNMYSLQQNPNFKPKSDAIERAFGSNVCRCTGYRSIIQAFKTVSKDDMIDIEDLNFCQKTGKPCKKDRCSEDEWCFLTKDNIMDDNRIVINLKDNKTLYRVDKLSEAIKILNEIGTKSYMLLAGNTARGIYPILEYPEILIDISSVEELKNYKLDETLSLGAGNTLSEIENIFKTVSSRTNFGYLDKFYEHLDTVAHIPVKNIATVGGNLMIKNQYKEFQSDLVVLFETVGATIKIVDKGGLEQDISVRDFITTNMEGKIITSVELPPLSDENRLVTYKIMPRSQNALAHINAGFLYKLNQDGETVSAATIVYGGISSGFIHASKTESYLVGKNLFKNETLQGALKVLQEELVVEDFADVQNQGKKKLAIGVFYKTNSILVINQGINLVANHNVTMDDQNNYDVYGAALSEVELDILTGEIQVSRVDLLEDVGRSLNPEIDVGLIEGAFVMGMGYWTSEQLFYDAITGKQLTDRTSKYYVPLATDIPLKYIISFKSNASSDSGTLGAKACADPSICMAISVPFAIREAMTLSRMESGIPTTTWFDINGAYSIDNILNALNVNIEEFKFY